MSHTLTQDCVQMHRATLSCNHSEAQIHTHMQAETHTHSSSPRTGSHLQTPQATLSPAPRLSYKCPHAPGTWSHSYTAPGTSGSQSQAYGTLILVCHLTCICPLAAGGPETKQPQARGPRCPHPGSERSATAAAPENHRNQEGRFLSSHSAIQHVGK